MQKPKRGERTAKHVSKKQAHEGMAKMMQRKVSKTVQMKEQTNKGAKRN
jgi:hypothetical protein